MKIAYIVKDYAIEVTPAMLAKISYYLKGTLYGSIRSIPCA
jgi:hypothetical protein